MTSQAAEILDIQLEKFTMTSDTSQAEGGTSKEQSALHITQLSSIGNVT